MPLTEVVKQPLYCNVDYITQCEVWHVVTAHQREQTKVGKLIMQDIGKGGLPTDHFVEGCYYVIGNLGYE